MTREQRQHNVRLGILKLLDESGDYMFPEPQLYTQTCIAVAPPPIRSEFDNSIRAMESRRWITGVRDEFDDVKWRITDLGRSILAEAPTRS